MVSTICLDIDCADEYVCNTTACAFSVVAPALGIPTLLPFLKAICHSQKLWQAHCAGVHIIQQIAIMMGCAILPHLCSLVSCVARGLTDKWQKVQTVTALATAALAEVAAPYRIESSDEVLWPLWLSIHQHRRKGLAAFLKVIGFIIPLMDPEYALYYMKEVMVILIHKFQMLDEEMKKIVLMVIKQCTATNGVTAQYIKQDIPPDFFKLFWIAGRIMNELKDEAELYCKMVMETITKVVATLSDSDIDKHLEVCLVDGIACSFQEQTMEGQVMLDGFSTVIDTLALNNKCAKVCQQTADLTTQLTIIIIKQCDEDQLLSKLGLVLFEQLREEYPGMLDSIIATEGAITNVVIPRMTPILHSHHKKAQEASMNLIGHIMDCGAEFIPAQEWMGICFESLDLLKAHKQAVCHAAVDSFRYITKSLGPQDVLLLLPVPLCAVWLRLPSGHEPSTNTGQLSQTSVLDISTH
ncbi:armadillo-type protein [Pisolithus orientalis]|uniref:armadillo-type protein n=1 Tax=Pisolithus orientalis TaxID=936130 RepID=UPI002224E582|nr:armadillo-type protein [Pisolithus orientalis]KAI6028260.1 armadillo-type protein [Pisolithus orientalis]